MPERDAEVVRNAFAAFERGDIEAVLELCAKDIVITQAPELPGAPAEQRGHQGLLDAFALWPEQWDDYRTEVLRIVEAPGGKVFATQRTRGRGKQSGIEVEMDFSFVFTIRDGKICEWQLFVQEDQALEAAGLSE